MQSATVTARPTNSARDPISEAKARLSQYLTQADALITHITASPSPALILTPDTDADGPTVLFANPAFLNRAGKRLKDIVGRSAWSFMVDPSDATGLGRLRAELAEAGFARTKRRYTRGDTTYVQDVIVSRLFDEKSRRGVFLAVQPGT